MSICAALRCPNGCWGYFCPDHSQPGHDFTDAVTAMFESAHARPDRDCGPEAAAQVERLLGGGEPVIGEQPPAEEKLLW